MSSRSLEAGGDTPNNRGLSDFKVLPEQRGIGPRVQKPNEPKQQPTDAKLEATGQLQNEPRETAVYKNPLQVPRPLPQKPGEQRGEPQPFQPNPAEQQAAERLGKPPPKPEAERVRKQSPIPEFDKDTVQRFAEVQEKLKRFPEGEQKRIRRVYFHFVLDQYRDDIGFHQPGRIMEMIEMLDKIVEIYSRERSDVEREPKHPPSDPPDHDSYPK